MRFYNLFTIEIFYLCGTFFSILSKMCYAFYTGKLKKKNHLISNIFTTVLYYNVYKNSYYTEVRII